MSPSHSPAWGPSRRRQFSINISCMSSSHRQQFCTKCCKVGYTADGVQSFRHSLGDPTVWFPKGSQVLPGSLFQHGPPMGSQPPLRHPLAPAWVSSTGCRGTLALVPGVPPAPPSPLTLMSELFLSHVLTLLFSACSYTCTKNFFFFPSQTCYHRGVPTIPDGLSLGQLWVHPGAGFGSAGHEGSFKQLLIEATAVAPLLPRPTCINQTHRDTENRRGTIILFKTI